MPNATTRHLHENLLYHIVLPRVLPQDKAACSEVFELSLLSRMTKNVENSLEWIPPATVRLFTSLQRTHTVRIKEMVLNEINALEPGEFFAMFIRSQNTAFMIHMPTDQIDGMKNVHVMTFPGNLSPEKIYGSSSDLQFTYPAQALKMKFSPMMRSKEFAHQLCLLYDTLPTSPIGKRNRNYVNTWLTSVLDDQPVVVDNFKTVTKKLRDEVLGESKNSQSGLSHNHSTHKSNYFRRSNFYSAIKVFLHLSLTIELGMEDGRLVYKIVMLQFLTRMCEEFENSSCEILNVDLITQLMAKIARRIEKLQQTGLEGIDDATKEFYGKSIRQAKESIAMLRHKVDKQIERLQLRLKENSRLKPLVGLDFLADVHQEIPKLREYLEKRKSASAIQSIQNIPVTQSFSRHKIDLPNLPAVSTVSSLGKEIDKNLLLVDCENWILYKIKFEANVFDCETLRDWYIQYASVGDQFYAGDQIGTSRMLLVRLKLLAIIDRIASEAHPLLLEHRSNINAGVFDILLLPQKIDMQIAFELQQYFNRRNTNARHHGLIEQSGVSSESFSVKFAARNEEMQSVRREILAMGDGKIEEKRREWERVREEVRLLRDRASRLNHEYITYTSLPYTEHSSACSLCSLESQIKRCQIYVYERPLPDSSDEQNAVAFELRIPIEIAALRDVLHLTTKFGRSASNGLKIKGCWTGYHQISYANKSKYIFVTMGSTCMASMSQHHVDLNFESFVSTNSWNCILQASSRSLSPAIAFEAVKKNCTLSTEPKSAYDGLQWTLNTTLHTQNQVLARQSECPQNLSLSEFKNFGSLRADGHRLQLRKLYAMLETESLSFDQLSVSSLIQQTFWETGITDHECGFIRASHTDFQDTKFTFAMIDLLGKFADKQKDNWVHPIKLLTTTLAAVRIFEINHDEVMAAKLVMLLNQIRAILAEWMEKIENAFQEMSNRSQTEEEKLRLSLVIVAISGALTFFVSSQHEFFDKIFATNGLNGFSASRMWLQSIIILESNILLDNDIQNKSQTNLRMFIRMIRFTGVHIEEKIRKSIKESPENLYDLIKRQWTKSSKGQIIETDFSENLQVAIVAIQIEGIKKYVTIDLITGSFLVDNLPVARLPHNIVEGSLFKRTFKQYVFEIQPDASNSFSTVYKYNNCSYEFRWTNDQCVIITEHRADPANQTERELIPHEILTDQIPELLILNHSHWWNKTENTIDLRPKGFTDENFSDLAGVTYKIDMNTSRLKHMKTGRCMLDVNSGSYRRIREHLARLERRKYIHVLMDGPSIAKVELVRMNLKFKIDCSVEKVRGYDMVSNEFSGMRVSLVQNCGTLFGLNHGLLLESMQDAELSNRPLPSSKWLILPHSTIQSTCKDSHVSVDIDLKTDLQSPPFHRYQIDEFLRQLKPSNSNFSAWFYLAQLHATTSHGEIEPVTGMTGTERALQILQSSFVWSTAPYNSEALKILMSIAELSPKRQIKESVQKVTWPKKILGSSAQDTFIFIVNKLIEDSLRLSGLHFHHEKMELKKISNPTLCIRDYLRCLQLRPNLRVLDSVIPHGTLETSVPNIPAISYSPNSQLLSILYHRAEYRVPNLDLKSFLTSADTLDGPIYSPEIISILNHDVTVDFRNYWISLYNVARKQQFNREQFALILSLYTHHECNEFGAILVLQTIAENPEAFVRINPPEIGKYQTSQGIYKAEEVRKILMDNYTKPSTYNDKSWSATDRVRHDKAITLEINRLTSLVTENWPCDNVNLQSSLSHICTASANGQIRAKLLMWNNNRKLNQFIVEIESKLLELSSTSSINPTVNVIHPKATKTWTKYQIDFETNMTENLDDYKTISREANDLLMLNKPSKHSAEDWWKFYDRIVNSHDNQHLIDAGIYPRMVPSLVLPQIACEKTNPKLKTIIGALAVTIASEQRLHRIECCKNQPQLKPALDRELENKPHLNWKPCDYPEWLLFEIEQNLTIRRIQVEIAKRMVEPPETRTKHSVMQLNMGEGKTAVIVPILASILADGTQACQITVLKSLFATNLNSLRQYLGGMLNRRMYTFPCRRDMPISQCVSKILDIYEECKEMKGVILTLPEYRLSFQLKIYESVQKEKKDDISAAGLLLKVHKWIDSNVRSILDESDAILHAKYQLIYTVGNQMPLDGGVNRWTVTQAVLKRVPHHMYRLYKDFGAEQIEFDPDYVRNGRVYGAPTVNYRSDVFTPCRIIDESIYGDIKNALIEDFLDGRLDVVFPEMTTTTKNDLKQLLSLREIDTETFNEVMRDFAIIERHILMILSGLLRFEVLKLALMKRWRVSYGVNEKGTRKMAIPFKAKDVASEMTEFGHPDVAICLTQLSYYYSGLTDHQLLRVFEVLKSNQNAAAIYEKWIGNVPKALRTPSIESYSGVNLSDPNQREQLLFPLFRFNMHIIDYWLSAEVYPREAKTFEKKLICTAWDLCSDHMKHRVTGFSGTNDTKNILPLPIAQNDLEELEETNENVRKTLLRPENQAYEKLPVNVSGRTILERLVEKDIPVLLDSGALMLELNNEEMAREWLRLASQSEYDAAVYFDRSDVLQTIDRNGIVAEFDCSVYRNNLNRCLVYLDDSHTRGTDLKFPLGWKACVTLSGDIARDKTVQACMRMRQLGRGHAIAFWASHEADIRIRHTCNLSPNDSVSNEHVIRFICGNSQRFETENTVHWAAGAYNYTQKLAGHKLHDNSVEETSMIDLYEKCVDNEFVTLENMYGDGSAMKLTDIAEEKFDQLSEDYAGEETIVDFIENIDNAVLEKLNEQAPNVTRFRHALDEEQEKELEHELEEERQVERPPSVEPATPTFDAALKILFSSNSPNEPFKILKSSGGILSLSESLTSTQLFNAYTGEVQPWSDSLFVTQDFSRVINGSSFGNDDFLRPIWWIAGVRISDGQYRWILLSSFECDRLISTFHNSKQSALFMYRPRLSKFHDNLLHERRLLVTGMAECGIDLKTEVEIGVYAGSMFFRSETEQNAYCGFLGLIPRERTPELDVAFDNNIIKPNGFVPLENRDYSASVWQCVGECRFHKNPVDLVINLISAHHQFLRKESHVASIVDRGFKLAINDDNNN